jgi:hypothetical protein
MGRAARVRCLLAAAAILALAASAQPLGVAASASTPSVSPPQDLPACQTWFTEFPTPNSSGDTNFLKALAPITGTDVWAVGDHTGLANTIYQTLAEHWNGTAWITFPTPSLGGGNNLLLSAAAPSSNDVWAVGAWYQTYDSTQGQTLIEHWDGSSWSVVPSPNVANSDNQLLAVRALSKTNVIAVGRAEQSNGIGQTLIEQWNGTSWVIVASPNGLKLSELNGVVAISPSDIWAVGDQTGNWATSGMSWSTLIEHWDGATWSIVPSPNFSGYGGSFFDVGGVAANDLWAVGNYSPDGVGTDFTAIAHYDGTSWTVVPSPSPGRSDLYSVAFLSSNNGWAVGRDFISGTSLAEHWDGTSWQIEYTPPIQYGMGTGLLAVAVSSAHEIWTVGWGIRAGKQGTLAEHRCVAPTITSVTPSTGPATGGTVVTVAGTGLDSTTNVYFGPRFAAATNVVVNSASQVTATSPIGPLGTVDVWIGYGVSGFHEGLSTNTAQFTYTATAPLAPSVGAIAGEASANVYWSPPASDGGVAISSYTVTPYIGAAAQTPIAVMGSPPATSVFVSGLADGIVYTFTVSATNPLGTSPPSSPSNPVMPGRGRYHALVPARILDTRDGTGGSASPLGGHASRAVQVTGQGGVPSTGVSAVVLNVTVTNPSEPSYLTVWPTGLPRPEVSSLNWGWSPTGYAVPNLVQVAVGVGGQVSIYNAAGSADVIFDVAGYVAAPLESPGGDGFYTPVVPQRVLDTRDGTGGVPVSAVGPGGTVSVRVNGQAAVPTTGVSAVVLNVTVTGSTAPSYLTAWPTGVAQPVASNLNFSAGQTVANRVVVQVGSNGTPGWVSFYNAAGSVHVIADVGGWFSDGGNPAATGSRFVGVVPSRILDTRVGTPPSPPVGPGQTIVAPVAGLGGVPAMNAAVAPTAVVLNVTVTDTVLSSSYLTVWPDGDAQPVASDLNWVQGRTVPNLVVVKVGPNGKIDLFNAAGFTQIVVDVVGWYG